MFRLNRAVRAGVKARVTNIVIVRESVGVKLRVRVNLSKEFSLDFELQFSRLPSVPYPQQFIFLM